MPVKVYDGTNWVTVAGDGAQGPAGTNATSSSISTWVKTASGGETSVSGTGDTGYGTLAYTVGQELVYLNGVLLDRGDDYTATNGTSITGLTALAANDIVTVWTVNSFSVANTYTIAQADAAFAPAAAGGLVLIKSQTIGSAVSTVSVTDAFNSNYENYKIVISGGVSSAANGVHMQMTGTSTGYYMFEIYGGYGSASVAGYASANGTQWYDVAQCTTDSINSSIELFSPQAAKPTSFNSRSSQTRTTGTVVWNQGYLANSTQYTGFTIYPQSGTFTGGTIRVYGYKNS